MQNNRHRGWRENSFKILYVNQNKESMSLPDKAKACKRQETNYKQGDTNKDTLQIGTKKTFPQNRVL